LRFLGRAAAGAFLAAAGVARAAVVDVSATGFVVRHEATVAGSPANVYRLLTTRVGSWWHPDHTHSKDSKNLSIDPRPGGCFCERLPGGGGAEHMRVVIAAPGEVLRMTGALGPLQEWGLSGSMTWKLTARGSSTHVELSYAVGGFFGGGFEKIAPAVDGVVGDQLRRFSRFAATGDPTEKKP
jgi:uncharacterized protein YndB with AHSA1/START domain